MRYFIPTETTTPLENSTTYVHLRLKHFDHKRSLNPVTSPEDIPELNSDTLFAENTQLLTADQRLKSSALCLLKSKEIDHLSQHSLDNIVGEVTSIVQKSLSTVERRVSCTLSANVLICLK